MAHHSLPYPSFSAPPTTLSNSLAAIGRCRIPLDNEDILAKCRAAHDATNKDTKKQLLQQAVTLTSTVLRDTWGLDVSIVQVEVLIVSHVGEMIGTLVQCVLDAGCAVVVLNTDQERQHTVREALSQLTTVPRERLAVHCHAGMEDGDVTVAAAVQLLEGVRDSVQTVSFAVLDAVELDAGIRAAAKESGVDLVMELASNDAVKADAVTGLCCKQSDNKDEPNVAVCLVDPSAELLGKAYAGCIKTDRSDGLFTTVVCSRAGEALGLVYSSTESIVAALECGRGVYYSRSRNGLWRKGDTSGHFQTLHRLDVDCDGDALRFTVTQQSSDPSKPGAFCHLETYTCWGEPQGLRHLEHTLQERLREAPEGSYTQRLFKDPELLRNKLVEEAQELAEAEEPQHVAEELADVLYFAMVRAAAAGVSIDAAVAELDRRRHKLTRRPGNSKAHRIAAGDKILNKEK